MPATLSNKLIDSLPPADRSAVSAMLKPVGFPNGFPLFGPDETPRSVTFLTSGCASLITEMAHGEAVEVGLVGREGLPGSLHLLGRQTGPTRRFMQLPGTGLQMSFEKFQQEFENRPALRHRVLQHVKHEAVISMQLAACNRVHEVEERLARWLLMVQDRADEPTLNLTQEFLSQMLGARRSTVTIVAGALQRSGLIEYSRGKIRILDRASLESAACECYQVTAKLYKNLYQEPA